MPRSIAAEPGQPGKDAVVVRSRRLVVADAGLGLLGRPGAAGEHGGSMTSVSASDGAAGGTVTAACSNPPCAAPGRQQLGEVLRADPAVGILLAPGLVAPPPRQRRVGSSVGVVAGVGRAGGCGTLGVEHPRVEVAEPAADAVRRGLGEDQDAERGEDAEHDARADVGEQERERLAEHPAEHAAGLAQRGKALARLRATAADVAEARRSRGRTASNPMPMRPLSCTDAGCRNSQPARRRSSTGSTKATRPTSPPAVYALMCLRDLVADEEPLVDGAGDREQHEEERESVAALVLLERLGSEGAEQPAGAVREAHPGADEERAACRLLRRSAWAPGRACAARDEDAFAGARPLLVGLELLAMPPRYGGGP